MLQLILNVIDHEMDIAQSIEAQRLHHQWLPDFTIMEPRAASVDTLEKYQGYGHEVRVRNIGMAMGVYHDFENGIFLGAADSRGATRRQLAIDTLGIAGRARRPGEPRWLSALHGTPGRRALPL